jgi:hypothetical protein
MASSWLAPERHEGWPWFRIGFAAAGLLTWLPRATHIVEAHSSAGIVIAAGRIPLSEWVIWSPPTAWALWGLTLASLLVVGIGRWVRPALVVYVACACALLFAEGLNMKAFDRLMLWQAMVLFLAPGAAVRVVEGTPTARYTLLLVYVGLYGMTGWNKLLEEPEWWTGKPLAYDFVELRFGGTVLGSWASGQPWLLKPMSWMTLIFEGGFPLFALIPRLRAWALFVGLGFHVFVALGLNVNTFSYVAVAAYPVLLDPARFAWLRGHAIAAIHRLRPA